MRATAAWTQVPVPSPVARTRSRWAIAAVTYLTAAVGPVARANALPYSLPEQVALVLLVATAAMSALALATRWGRGVAPAVALVAGAVLFGTQGLLISGWAVIALWAAAWIHLDVPPLPVLPKAAAGSVAPVTALLVVAAVLGLRESHTWQPLVPAVLALAMPVLAGLGGGTLARVSDRVGYAAGRGVAAVAFGALGLAILLPSWAIGRLLRVDPLDTGAHGWAHRRRTPRTPARPWATDAVVAVRAPAVRVRSFVATTVLTAAVMAVLAAGAWTLVRDHGDDTAATVTRPRGFSLVPDLEDQPVDPATDRGAPAFDGLADDGTPNAYVGADWYDEYNADFNWLMSEQVAWRPFDLYRLRDGATRWVNIRNEQRVTWTPPPCECRRLTVWVYGGSTTFGLGQRDEHTIPSELARVAAEQGVTLDVSNRGIPGQMHWTEAQRFSLDLTMEDPPDLVVFYDGANELWGATTLSNEGWGDIDPPIEPLLEDMWNGLDRTPEVPPTGPPGSRYVGFEPYEWGATSEIGKAAATRYARALQVSRDAAEARDLPIRWYWQPSRHSRPNDELEPRGDGWDENYADELYGAAAANVPDDVVDLSDVFDDYDGPLFTDDVHHNEIGARIVAEAIYADLAPEIARLLSDPGAGR